MAFVSLIETLGLRPTVTYDLRYRRQRETLSLLTDPPADFRVEALNSPRRICDRCYRVTGTVTSAELWRLVCATFREGLLVIDEPGRALHVEAADIDELDRECVRRICGNAKNVLELVWHKEACGEVLEDELADQTWEGPLSQEAYECAVRLAIKQIHAWACDYYPVDMETARAHIAVLLPPFEQMRVLSDWNRSERTVQDYRANLGANPQACPAPAGYLRDDIERARESVRSAATPLSSYTALVSLTEGWQACPEGFTRHYDLFAAGCALVNQAIANLVPVQEKLVPLLREMGEQSRSVATMVACLDYLAQSEVAHRLDPRSDHLHWSSFRREMPAAIARELGAELPTHDEYFALWSRRSHMAMHICEFLRTALETTSWTQAEAMRAAAVLAEAGPRLGLAKTRLRAIARVLADRSSLSAARTVLEGASGQVPETFEIVAAERGVRR